MKKAILIILLAMPIFVLAQHNLTPAPQDSSVLKGTLPNGLTYYIKHNEQPKQRAEFHIAQNVGAILELDNQNGLAHFLEHMAFNGSKNFADKGIINYFEKIGVNFGGNINAYTSLDETVYRLSEVPTYREGIIDTALLALYDWSNALTLDNEEIDKERGVILEEWRTRANASRRMWKVSNQQKYHGSQYAKRDVIGDTSIIKNFEYQALKDYYKKWYGPDLQAIVVVGDIDPKAIEKKIIDLFSSVPPRANRGERTIYELPDNIEPIFSCVLDREAQQSRIQLEFKHRAQKPDFLLSISGFDFSIMNNLMAQIFSYRSEEQTLNPKANFVGSAIGYFGLNKAHDALYAIAMAKEGKEKEAFIDIYTEIEKTYQTGFTNSELERAKDETLNNYEKSYNERNNVTNISLAREYIRNYLDHEPMPSLSWQYQEVKRILPTITKEQLHKLFMSYVSENNLIISFQGAEKPEVVFPTKEQTLALIKQIKTTKFEAAKDEVIAKNLIDQTPKAGKVKQKIKSISLGTEEWILSNGVRVVFKPTEFKKDEILLNAFSWGGLNMVETNDIPSALFASNAAEYSGLGNFSYLDLQKALAGKTVAVHPSIATFTENFNGNSSVKDFETMLQLVYLYFVSDRKDEEAFRSFKETLNQVVGNREKNPKAVFSDSVLQIWNCHDLRDPVFNLDLIQKADYQKALKIFRERFSNINDFTFIFTGNVDVKDKKMEKLICTWLGGLKKGKTESYTAQSSCHPKGNNKYRFNTKMEIDNVSNAIRYYAPMNYTWKNSLNMTVLGSILDIRYLESIRESEGGSYGVGVRGNVTKYPEEMGILRVQFDGNPEKIDRLLEIVHSEIDEILKNGVRADDLQKTKESLLKDYQENLEKNYFWSSILATYYIYGRNTINDYKKTVESITSESVKETLKQLVSSGNVLEISMQKEK